MFITHEYLRRRRACAYHREIFRDLFPDGVEMTVENLLYAQSKRLDVSWVGVFPSRGGFRDMACDLIDMSGRHYYESRNKGVRHADAEAIYERECAEAMAQVGAAYDAYRDAIVWAIIDSPE